MVSRILDRVRQYLRGRTKKSKVFAANFVPPEEASDLAKLANTELARQFYDHQGRLVHKWLHYLDIYDKHFSVLRLRSSSQPLRMLEIGVFEGGSLDMWRRYFGPEAVIFGIDIDPACAAKVDAPNQVRIGSQDDPTFLASVLAEMGTPDIVLDDGSHIGRHQKASFAFLFPRLSEGGLYVIEDLHSSYWGGFYEGGHRKKGSGIEQIKELIDDLHGHYHDKRSSEYLRDNIGSITIYDSIAIIEKRKRGRLGHLKIEPKSPSQH
jgi:hypothetical protein